MDPVLEGRIDWISGRIRDGVNHIAIISVEISRPVLLNLPPLDLMFSISTKCRQPCRLLLSLTWEDSRNLEREWSDRFHGKRAATRQPC